jgi:hypothetical protein
MAYWIEPKGISWDENTLKNFNQSMLRYAAGMNKTLEETMHQWAGRLAEEMLRESPPFVNKGASNTGDAKVAGEKTVKVALLQSVTPTSVLMKETNFTNKNLETLVRRRKYKDWEETTRYMPKLGKWSATPFKEDLHTNVRPRRSRYDKLKKQKVVTFDENKWKGYLRKLENRVGYLKAGWGIAAQALGRKVPAWVSRHLSYAKGDIKINLEGDNKTIVFSNYTPTITRFSSRYNYAMDWIGKRMLKQMDIALKAEAKKANR